MSQTYHQNAKLNSYSREIIQNSNYSLKKLSEKFDVSVKTIEKWKNRDYTQDNASKPHNISYALNDLQKALICSFRQSTWQHLDDILEMIQNAFNDTKISRSSVYRTLIKNGINKIPTEKREQAKKFKEYEPGFIHIDITYLPKLNGIKYYLYVAIDRATRAVFYSIYTNKTAENAESFLHKVKDFFPFYISHILTDNGAEFTDKFTNRKKVPSGNHIFDTFCKNNDIEHRLTKPYTPKTNGMVERHNGIVKSHTIKVNTYNNYEQMYKDIYKFLKIYNLIKRHGSLKAELNVKTPFEAIKKWFDLSPELFKIKPDVFKDNLLKLSEQPCET